MAGHTELGRDLDGSKSPSGNKEATQHIELVHTRDSEHGHAGYLDKDGLRIDNDDQDHYTEPPMSFNRMMSLVAMAFLWTGSQIPVYLFGGILEAPIVGSVVLTTVFYFPPPRVNSQGLSKAEIIKQVDYVGGLLSVSGMILFMAGMQWGGYQYPWSSAHVLCPLILGAILLIAFCVWETYGAKRQLLHNVYGHDPVGVGIRGLPVGLSILAGACIVLWLLSVFRGHNKVMMIVSSVLMTAGCGALSVARVDNLNQLWGILVVAGLGIGGIVVPASIITTIICPDDLIATVAALTLAIRVIGGSIGYCVYYNIFINRFVPAATHYIGGTMIYKLNITSPAIIKAAIELTGASLLPDLQTLPGIKGVPGAYEMVVFAGQLAYAEAYKYVYYVSIAFGAVSIIAACFLGDINKYMDDHVAVVIH
ncbi:MFS general substrate transporter [Aureobasidium sp. EXF-3400]|nr:MFS general substrate transporter [Aureobasidium sp. EXF-12344]KAI4768659.1 MFS general substrate transporter [Aureobasidium sp. EXF-3400]